MKKCPYCAEEIQDEAIVCKHCNRDIEIQPSQGVSKDADTKKVIKSIVLVVLFILGIAYWYIAVPVAILWFLWKSKKISKKNKKIVVAITVIIFLVINSTNVYSDRQPTVTITEPQNNKSIQADSITVKGTVEPKKSIVTIQGNTVAVNDKGEFSYDVNLSNESNNITVKADNDDKTSNTSVTITRIFTEEEKVEQERLAEEKAKQRAKQQEEDAKRKEEEKKQKAEEDERDDGTAAAVCAKNYVEASLKSPSTAKFPWASGTIIPLGDNKYTIGSYVDSQNGFGATIRTNYLCTVTVIDRSNYLCSSACEFDN